MGREEARNGIPALDFRNRGRKRSHGGAAHSEVFKDTTTVGRRVLRKSKIFQRIRLRKGRSAPLISTYFLNSLSGSLQLELFPTQNLPPLTHPLYALQRRPPYHPHTPLFQNLRQILKPALSDALQQMDQVALFHPADLPYHLAFQKIP